MQQLKVLITGEEIGEATNTVDILVCDEAASVVKADMKEQDIQK